MGLFFLNSSWWSALIAVAVCVAVYFLEVFTDLVFPRVKWQTMLKAAWIVTLVAGVLNLVIIKAIP